MPVLRVAVEILVSSGTEVSNSNRRSDPLDLKDFLNAEIETFARLQPTD